MMLRLVYEQSAYWRLQSCISPCLLQLSIPGFDSEICAILSSFKFGCGKIMCAASPKSLSAHQTPSEFLSLTLKISSSSVLRLKEKQHITCVSARTWKRANMLHVFMPVLTSLLLSNHGSSSCISVSWPQGNCLEINRAPADPATQKGRNPPPPNA